LIQEEPFVYEPGQIVDQILKFKKKYGFNVLNSLNKLNDSISKIDSIDPNERKKLFGQVFTPRWVADYMASLCIKRGDERGIEPCFGKGIFITNVAKRLLELNRGRNKKAILNNITGIELDPKIFLSGISEYIDLLGTDIKLRNLHLGSFFDFKKGFGEYDFGIMNPPYVRQEDLSLETLPENLRKEYLFDFLKKHYPDEYLTLRSNLYIYFFLHLSNFLKEGGKLVAITYNSWLFTKFGKVFQKFLLDNFKVKYIIDFDKEAFDDAIIGSCIVLLEKCTGENNKTDRDNNLAQFIRLKAKAPLKNLVAVTESLKSKSKLVHRFKIRQEKLGSDDKWERFFYTPDFHSKIIENPNITRLDDLAKVWRGLGTKANEYFVINEETAKKYKISKKFLTPFLKNPRDLKGWKTSESQNHTFLLNVERPISELEKLKQSKGLLNYLDHIKKVAKENKKKYRTLNRQFSENKDKWHVERPKPAGALIFNYIIRGNKAFYINDTRTNTSDNFHNIESQHDIYCLYAILNSSLTNYMLELSGRTQGSGLLKIQVYELKGLKVPDFRKMQKAAITKLSKLGKKLSENQKTNNKNDKIIKKIDVLVYDFLNLSQMHEKIIESENQIMESRLNKKL